MKKWRVDIGRSEPVIIEAVSSLDACIYALHMFGCYCGCEEVQEDEK